MQQQKSHWYSTRKIIKAFCPTDIFFERLTKSCFLCMFCFERGKALFLLGVVFKVNKCKFGYIVFSLFGWICIISSRLFTYTLKDVNWYVLTNWLARRRILSLILPISARRSDKVARPWFRTMNYQTHMRVRKWWKKLKNHESNLFSSKKFRKYVKITAQICLSISVLNKPLRFGFV